MAYPIVPLINGKSYEWADIVVNVLGLPIIGITNIEYEEKQGMENIYGAGRMPVSRGYGKIETTAKMTVLMEELETINVIARRYFYPSVNEFKIYPQHYDCPISEDISRRIICLPCHDRVNINDVNRICWKIREFI